jgi:hypothetical protein
MALPVFDLATTNEATDPTNPHNFSHTTAGSDLGLLVFAFTRDGTLTDGQISTITYNGISMVKVDTIAAGSDMYMELWQLKAPAVGANTVSINFVTSGVARRFRAIAVSYTATNQDTLVEASNKATGTDTAPSVSVTTLTADAMVVDGVGVDDFPDVEPLTVNGSQTQRANFNPTDGQLVVGSSEESKATPGAVSMDWTLGTGGDWVTIVAALKPVGGVADTGIATQQFGQPQPIGIRREVVPY